MLVEIFLGICLIFLFCKYFTMKPKKFPPGPPNYPLIGGLLSLPEVNIHFKQQEWLKDYGNIVGIMMGPQPGIFIQGLPHIEDALKKPEFQGRPQTSEFKNRSFGKLLGIFFSDGDTWLTSRKFTVKYLKSFKNMEDIMQLEMVELEDRIRNGVSYMMTDIFKESTVNVIWTILSGMRCTVQDKRIKNILENITNSFRNGRPGGRLAAIFNLIPFLKKYSEIEKIQLQTIKSLQDFLRESIREHRDTLDRLNPRDFFDAYLIEQITREESGVNDNLFTEEDLIVISMDIFTASYESLNSTMSFIVLYLILYPEIQIKLHEELDKHLGSRKPNLQDKSKLDYVEALINEIYRINPIAPIVAPHRALEDSNFYDYFIPKNTLIFVSLWSVTRDENIFKNPEKFNPNRFLNEDNKFVRNPHLNNFGLGRRICAGDFIAQNVLFLYITTFFQKYSVHVDPNNSNLSTEALPGFTTSPIPFKAIIKERY